MESPNPNNQFPSNADVSETKAVSSILNENGQQITTNEVSNSSAIDKPNPIINDVPNPENNGAVHPDQAFEIECKYCSGKFSNKQALGGHMNAHRFERSMEKAARNAHAYAGAVMNRPIHPPLPPMINHHGLVHSLNPNHHSLIPGYVHPVPGLNNASGAAFNSNLHPRIVPGWPLVLPAAARAPAQLVARPLVGMNIRNNNFDGINAHSRGGGGRVEEDVDQTMVDASGLDLTLRVGYSNRD